MPIPESPQFMTVFHASRSDVPPHRQAPTPRQLWTPDSNLHPDVIHAGSDKAALDIMGETRPYIHEYTVEMEHPRVSPVIWGDEPQILQEDEDIAHYRKMGVLDDMLEESKSKTTLNGKSLLARQVAYMDRMNAFMKGRQPGLWEETPADVVDAAKRNVVMPYRNRREDIGSISFLIPKRSVGGAVTYGGVKTRKEFIDDIIKRTVGQNPA